MNVPPSKIIETFDKHSSLYNTFQPINDRNILKTGHYSNYLYNGKTYKIIVSKMMKDQHMIALPKDICDNISVVKDALMEYLTEKLNNLS